MVWIAGALEGVTVADAVRFVSAGTSAPGINYVHTDHLGSPQKMTDANQAIVWDAVYTPFGQVHSITGTATNNQRFPGQYFDQGYHQNWFRDYAPSTGRYIESDPIGLSGGLNTYAYVGGNPLYWTDPLGLIIPGDPDPTDEVLIGTALYKLYQLYKKAKGAESLAELQKHLGNLEKAKKEIEALKRQCLEARGKKRKSQLEEQIEKLEQAIKGHEKEIGQKWPEALDQ